MQRLQPSAGTYFQYPLSWTCPEERVEPPVSEERQRQVKDLALRVRVGRGVRVPPGGRRRSRRGGGRTRSGEATALHRTPACGTAPYAVLRQTAAVSARHPVATEISTHMPARAITKGLPVGAVQTSNHASTTKRVAVDTAGNAILRSRRTASHAVAAKPAAITTSRPVHATGQCRALTLAGRLSARYTAHGSRTAAETAVSPTSHRNAGLTAASEALPISIELPSFQFQARHARRAKTDDTTLQSDSANGFCRIVLRYA